MKSLAIFNPCCVFLNSYTSLHTLLFSRLRWNFSQLQRKNFRSAHNFFRSYDGISSHFALTLDYSPVECRRQRIANHQNVASRKN
jgi:hypothetical protein